MTYIHKIIDLATGETVEQEYTAAQLAEVAEAEAKEAQKATDLATKAAEKSALLEKLGISEDEAKLLLS
jgi:hypothetical protein